MTSPIIRSFSNGIETHPKVRVSSELTPSAAESPSKSASTPSAELPPPAALPASAVASVRASSLRAPSLPATDSLLPRRCRTGGSAPAAPSVPSSR